MATDFELLVDHFTDLKTARGVAVTYRRPQQRASADITVVRGNSQYEGMDTAGATVRTHKPDFLIELADIGFYPEEGHVIETAAGDKWRVIADGKSAWTWHIEDHSVRVTTTLIEKKDAS